MKCFSSLFTLLLVLFLFTKATNAGVEDCPAAEDISPCICSYVDGEGLYLDCTGLQTEEELTAIFQQDFPVKEFYLFEMRRTGDIRVLGDVFNGVTFQQIDIIPNTVSQIEQVHPNFLLSNADVLLQLHLRNSLLTSEGFPWEVVGNLTKLRILALDINQLTDIPPLHRETLYEFAYLRSNVTELKPGE